MNVELHPDELLALAQRDIEKERYDEALLKLKRARAILPPDLSLPEIDAELGRLYARLGLRERARQAFSSFLNEVPAALHERFQLGMVLFEMGDAPAALVEWQHILRQSPSHPPALYYGALANAQLGELSQARRSCQLLVDNVASDNLYFDQAQQLMQRIEADPNFRELPAGASIHGPATH